MKKNNKKHKKYEIIRNIEEDEERIKTKEERIRIIINKNDERIKNNKKNYDRIQKNQG